MTQSFVNSDYLWWVVTVESLGNAKILIAESFSGMKTTVFMKLL